MRLDALPPVTERVEALKGQCCFCTRSRALDCVVTGGNTVHIPGTSDGAAGRRHLREPSAVRAGGGVTVRERQANRGGSGTRGATAGAAGTLQR